MPTTMERVREAGAPRGVRYEMQTAPGDWTQASAATTGALLRWVEASGDALAGVDARGRVAFANAAFSRTFATIAPRDADARPPLSRFVPLLSTPRLRRWLAESVATPGGTRRVHRLLAESVGADGERFLCAVTLLPVEENHDGRADADTACLVALRSLDGTLAPSAPDVGVAGNPDTVELRTLVDAALRAIDDPEARRRCRIALHAPEARIAADPEAIREALVRVIDNACRHAPAHGPVTVRSRLDPADTAEGADALDRIVLTVADRGRGLARAHVQRAFEPFWRGPGAERVPGRGLGLTVARELVENQRGWIELRSASGVGTEVDLWLPAA